MSTVSSLMFVQVMLWPMIFFSKWMSFMSLAFTSFMGQELTTKLMSVVSSLQLTIICVYTCLFSVVGSWLDYQSHFMTGILIGMSTVSSITLTCVTLRHVIFFSKWMRSILHWHSSFIGQRKRIELMSVVSSIQLTIICVYLFSVIGSWF